MMRYSNSITTDSAPRELWIDCAKGIGAILVILGHTDFISPCLKNFIYSFHMPLFFILSGMTIHISDDQPFRQTAIKYAKAYLLPYVVLSAVNLVLQCLWLLWINQLNIVQIIKYLVGIVWCYANMDWMPNCSPLWFLPCTFLCKLLFQFIVQKAPAKLHIPLVLACVATSYVLYLTNSPRLPWNSATALMAVSFLWIGRQLRTAATCKKARDPRIAVPIILVLIVLSQKLVANGSNVGMNENSYGNLILFFISGLGYSLVAIALSHVLRSVRFFSHFLGQNTIIVIGFNYFALQTAKELYYIIPVIRNIPLNAGSLFCGTLLILSCLIFSWNMILIKLNRT